MTFLAFITYAYMLKVLISLRKQLGYGHFHAMAAILEAILKYPMS